jgi:serine/threonine-protein kinase
MSEQLGRVLSGRYRLVAPVGSGASAQVFLAEDTRLRRRVAVKLLHDGLAGDSSFLRRFRAEAQAAAALSHPNIVAVFDWGEDADSHGPPTPYLVTELLAGGSLRGVLDAGRRLTPAQALQVGIEAARGLAHAHGRGFVHRDIKPANLLFGEEGRLRIADFGLARALAEAAWTEPMGAALGTARYASPEQLRGESLDGRADVYALGLTLIEAVTGSVPFAADTVMGTRMARVDRPVPVPESLGPLQAVLLRAGQPDPADRPEAADLANGFVAAAADLDRPEPLPLAGLDGAATASGDDDDPTLLPPPAGSPPPVGPAARPPPPPVGRPGPTIADTGPRFMPAAAPEALPPPTGGTTDRKRMRTASPGRRRWVIVAAVVAVALLAGAATAWFELRVVAHDVPPLEGLDEVAALALIEDNGWEVDVDVERRDGTAPGQVLDQDPADGERLAEGEVVTIKVSEGALMRTVPTDLAGQLEADAIAALEAAGLGVIADPERPFDEEVPAGVVMGLAPGSPVEAETGTPIGIIVSAGPAPREVPAVTEGAGFAAVAAALADVQLGSEPAPQFSDEVPAGRVIGTDPAPGTEVPRDAVVQVIVSRGPDVVSVPNVSGRAVAEAVAALEAAGFTIAGVQGNPARPVIITDPQPGTTVRRGTAVLLFTGL